MSDPEPCAPRGRPLVEASFPLRMSELRRAKLLVAGAKIAGPWIWWNHGRTVGEANLICDLSGVVAPNLTIQYQGAGLRFEQYIPLVSMHMRFGGARWYAICPVSGNRCTTLVMPSGGGHFASVVGWDLSYASQREGSIDRLIKRIDRTKANLLSLPKFSRESTRARLQNQIAEAESMLSAPLFMLLTNQMDLSRTALWRVRLSDLRRNLDT